MKLYFNIKPFKYNKTLTIDFYFVRSIDRVSLDDLFEKKKKIYIYIFIICLTSVKFSTGKYGEEALAS